MIITVEYKITKSNIEISIAHLLDEKAEVTTESVLEFITQTIRNKGRLWHVGFYASLGNVLKAEELAPQLFPELY